MVKPLSKSFIFISGTFIGNNCWDEWTHYFENEGYKCITPAWPYKDALPEELRNQHSGAAIASTRLNNLIDYFAGIIASLPAEPIMIGHSLGGLIVQLLLQRGLGLAGVALHSFPPWSISSFKFSFLASWWESMDIFGTVKESYLLPFKKWKASLANGMSGEQQRLSYYKYAVPESKLVIRDAFKPVSKIDFKKEHAPLLLISGGLDIIIPAAVNYTNYKCYHPGNSITDYKDFSQRNHLVFGQTASRETADFILYWLEDIL